MPCINHYKQIYLQTYDKKNPQMIEIPSSMAVAHKAKIQEKFFYIQFSDRASFEFFPLKSFMDADILEQIRKGDALLVLDNSLEYFLDTVDAIYRDIVVKEDIPPKHIVFLSAVPTMIDKVRQTAKDLDMDEIKVEWFTVFEGTGADAIRQNKDLMPPIRKTKKWPKKYLCLNRRWRLHRPFMISMLQTKGLLKYGHISLAKSDRPNVDNWDNAFRSLKKMYPSHKFDESIRALGDLYLDTTDLQTNRAIYEDSIAPYYQDTFFSVVNETTYFEGIPFLSEKIFKVIAMGHPFILSSAPNTIQYLHKLGYKTFAPFIDETYDSITDHKKRMEAIVMQIEKLCKMDKNQTVDFISKIRPIVAHNFKVLKRNGKVENLSRKMN